MSTHPCLVYRILLGIMSGFMRILCSIGLTLVSTMFFLLALMRVFNQNDYVPYQNREDDVFDFKPYILATDEYSSVEENVFILRERTIRARARLGDMWVFVPFVYQSNNGPVFRKHLAQELGCCLGELKSMMRSRRKRLRIMRDNKEQLKKAYLLTRRGGLNLSNLCLYAGLGAGSEKDYCQNFLKNDFWVKTERFGWMGTGDEELAVNKRLEAFKSKYEKYLSDVLTLVVPHHGARKNSDDRLWKAVSPLMGVIPVNPSRGSYNHPSQELIEELIDNNIMACIVDGNEKSLLSENIVVVC